MLRRIAAIAALLLALAVPARSEVYEYSNEVASNLHYVCEDIDGAMTEPFRTAYAGALRMGDEILCGTMRTTYYHSEPGVAQSVRALLAVRREGRILLIGAGKKDGAWRTVTETDGFFAPEQAFDITVLPSHSAGSFSGAGIVMLVGEEEFHVSVQESGCVYLNGYRCPLEDGRAFELDIEAGEIKAAVRRDGQSEAYTSQNGVIPERLCAWTYDTVPGSIAQAKAFAQVNPVALEGDEEAYIFGVNFRERPTSQSRSMGKYTAKVRILGRQQGAVYPWYNVSVGETQGWVSGVYVLFWGDERGRSQIFSYASRVLDVARADSGMALVAQPGGSGRQMIPEGTLMHVIAENDGWLHVIFPRHAMTWKTDWDGTYGFVQESAVTVGASAADVRWK